MKIYRHPRNPQLDLRFIRKWVLLDHLGGHFLADVWKNNHFKNRTWGGIYFTSCTVLEMLNFPHVCGGIASEVIQTYPFLYET